MLVSGVPIDWSRLARAVTFYQARRYEYVEAPWAARDSTVAITAPDPEWRRGAHTDIGVLVGSAEQSFLEMSRHHGLRPGKYVACTPCFRVTEIEDEMHLRCFMKVELFQNDDLSLDALRQMKRDAAGFADRELERMDAPFSINWSVTPEGEDLNIGHVEIGSYGRRDHPAVGGWLYGTGVAEPRFSLAVSRFGGE